MNREAIYSGLFALVSSAPGVVYASRRMKALQDVAPGDTPALFMEQKGESVTTQTRLPSRWTLNVDLAVYVATGANDSHLIPASVINPILDAITARLMPPAGIGEQTLGGLVERCRVDGAIEIVEGSQGETALAVIPVAIFLPD